MQETCIKYTFHFVAILLAFVVLNSVSAQKIDEFTPRKMLTASDYKGKVDESVTYLANTHSIVSLAYTPFLPCGNGKVKLKVSTKISVSESSWMKLSLIKSPEFLNDLLSHEQGHYDMEEIFSIDLKHTLLAICFDKYTIKKQVDSIYKSMHTRYESLQRRYDTETEYMMDKEMQHKWKQRIAIMWKNIQH